jgi:hypothetical protein
MGPIWPGAFRRNETVDDERGQGLAWRQRAGDHRRDRRPALPAIHCLPDLTGRPNRAMIFAGSDRQKGLVAVTLPKKNPGA